jgi:Tol biopolymer transport system component
MTRLLAAALAIVLLASGATGAVGSPARDAQAGPRAIEPVPAAPLPAPPGRTTLLSRARGGGFPNSASIDPSMSANGRYVAFTSIASDLVPGDSPGTLDVFLLDRRTGRIRLAPRPSGAEQGTSSEPAISADGRWVAFTYQEPPPIEATTVVVPRRFVVLWNVRTDGSFFVTTKLRSFLVPVPAYQPSLSETGRFVAFTSTSDLAGGDDDGQEDVARWDRTTGDLVSVSPGFNNEPIAGAANHPSISGDGNLVAFVSDGGDSVVNADTGSGQQVYVRDIEAARTREVSGTPDGKPPRGEATDAAISTDGRYVAFLSRASNLTREGAGGVFRRDLGAGTTTMVSVTPDGAAASGNSLFPAISDNGNFVAWTSNAPDLVPEMAGRIAPAAVSRVTSEVYLRDMTAGETLLISVSLTNTGGGGLSVQPSIGGNGRFVAFASDSPQLVSGDGNKAHDVFLRDLPPVPVITPATLDLGSRAVDTESLPLAATLGNAGWSPLQVTGATITGANRKDFRIVADGCIDRELRRNEACTVSITFRPRDKGTRIATLEVADTFDGSPRTVRLRGVASKGQLVLDPPIGQPGIVTIVEGSGFPRNTPVVLTWSPGITPRTDPVMTDDNGDFRVPMLVFHNDRTGPRELQATPFDGSAFPPAAATMLVTRPSVIPPGFVILRLIDVPLVLVIRG